MSGTHMQYNYGKYHLMTISDRIAYTSQRILQTHLMNFVSCVDMLDANPLWTQRHVVPDLLKDPCWEAPIRLLCVHRITSRGYLSCENAIITPRQTLRSLANPLGTSLSSLSTNCPCVYKVGGFSIHKNGSEGSGSRIMILHKG